MSHSLLMGSPYRPRALSTSTWHGWRLVAPIDHIHSNIGWTMHAFHKKLEHWDKENTFNHSDDPRVFLVASHNHHFHMGPSPFWSLLSLPNSVVSATRFSPLNAALDFFPFSYLYLSLLDLVRGCLSPSLHGCHGCASSNSSRPTSVVARGDNWWKFNEGPQV